MHRLRIENLGPITFAEIVGNDFFVLTGKQSSGKSTVIKTIYLFRTIKEDIFNLINDELVEKSNISLKNRLIKSLRLKFLQIFGSTWSMDKNMRLEYFYNEDIFISIYLVGREKSNNYIWLDMSNQLMFALKNLNTKSFDVSLSLVGITKKQDELEDDLSQLFDDPYKVVFIPAGRSMLALLSDHILYLYSRMDYNQRTSLDYCTRNYIERILESKTFFTPKQQEIQSINQNSQLDIIAHLSEKILSGKYSYVDGEERIYLNNGKYVKLNYSSSGQQESVWICNLLQQYGISKGKTIFMIEEPESDLFPETQKEIIELISYVFNQGNQIILTTHSPYVLGTINNLLYANQLKEKKEEVSRIIDSKLWINNKNFSSQYVENGTIIDIFDEEINQIKNEIIDEISTEINREYQELFDIEMGEA